MEESQFNRRWHSPINVFMHLARLAKVVGNEAIEKSTKHQRVREARIAAILAFVLSQQRGLPTFIRLPLSDPPDAYLMQPRSNVGTMDLVNVEITSYRKSSKESLLDQLKRKKIADSSPYTKGYILLVELLTDEDVDFESINKYTTEHKIPFPIWILRNVQQSPDTIAEVVIVNPEVSRFLVNIGEQAHYYTNKYKVPHVIFGKRTGKLEKVRVEKLAEECPIAPWDDLQA